MSGRNVLLVTTMLCSTTALMLVSAQNATAANFTVTNLNDSGAGSLRQAIINSNATPGSNTITVQAGVAGTIALASDLPAIVVPASVNLANNTPGGIKIDGNFGLSVATAGTVTLSANSGELYFGNTTITSGTVNLGGLAAADFYSAGGSVLVMSPGTTLNIPASAATNTFFTNLSGGGTINNNSRLTLAGGDTTPQTFTGTISGSGGLTMLGGGENLKLSGATTYLGPTSLTASLDTSGGGFRSLVLQAGAANVLSPNSHFTLNGNATLKLNGFNQTIAGLDGTVSSLGALATIDLGAGTLTTGGDNQNATYFGSIIGTGGLTKTGGGIQNLQTVGNSSSSTINYSGSTLISAGTLQAANANAFSANSAHTVTAGATLDLNSFNQTTGSLAGAGNVTLGSATLTTGSSTTSTIFSGTISGTGGLTKAGNGVFTLTGVNTYTGATTVNGGVLNISGSLASSVITNTNLASVNFQGTSTAGSATINSSGNDVLFSDNASAANARINITAGGLDFTSSSTAANAVITNSGFTNFIGNASAANSSITNNSGGALSFGSYTLTFPGGIPTFNPFIGTGTAGNATIVNNNGGSTTFFNQSNAGTATITNNSGGSLLFQTATATAADPDAATARVFNNAGGKVDISGVNTGVSVGSIEGAGNISLGAKRLTLGNTNLSATISGVISDSGGVSTTGTGGGLTKIGTGTLTLSGANTYTGGTTISAGTLQLGNGGTSGSIVGNVTNNANLAFNRSDAVTFGGVIFGSGAVQQNGAGSTNLTATNTYTGATNVNAGTLAVNGSIASSSLTTVNAGTTLGGNGTVGNTTINGGTLSPGNSIGTLTVAGNLVLTAASSYMVEVSPASADRTNVTGTATLGGATVNANFAAGTYVAKQYTIVNATGGVMGTFNTLANTNLPGGFKSSLSYDGNNAFLNLALDLTPTPTPTPTGPAFKPLNINQTNVANALTGFFNRTGGIPMIFGALTPVGLTIASGELPTASQQATFDAMGMFLGIMTDPFVAGRGDPASAGGATSFASEDDAALAYAANGKARTKLERDAYAAIYRKAPVLVDTIQRWSVWAAGFGGSQTTQGEFAVLGSNTATSRIAGTAVGADYRFSPDTIAGFALAGGGTNFSLANGLGSGRSDLFQAGGFIRHNMGAAYITGALAYGWQDVTTDRTVLIAGDILRARFNANAWSGRVEGGYRFASPWMNVGLTPYAAGQFVTYELPAYAEQVLAGPGLFALNYAAKDVTASRSELGLRTDKSFVLESGIFTLRGRGAWAHNFNTDRSISATFQALPGASFVVNGAQQAADAALVTGSAEMRWRNGWSAAATFEGEFSDVTRSYAGKGVVRYAW